MAELALRYVLHLVLIRLASDSTDCVLRGECWVEAIHERCITASKPPVSLKTDIDGIDSFVVKQHTGAASITAVLTN